MAPSPEQAGAPSPFLDYVACRRDAVDAELAAAFALVPTDDLRRYLYRPLQDFCAHGGKRIRPALVLMGCAVTGGDEAAAMPVAAAVEHFQSAALIHDDIADESETRRGVACLHRTLGEGLAINAGDFSLVESFACVADDERVPASARHAVMAELCEMMMRTVEGQALDLGWARDGRWDVSCTDYLAMATLKTAHYSAASPLAMGAMVAGAKAAQVNALRSFGLDAGLAFQIQDDILNVVGDATAQGKDFRSDITEGKRTLMVCWALEHGSAEQAARLREILEEGTHDPAKLSRAVSVLEATGAVEHARTYASDLAKRAVTHLEDVGLVPGEALDALLAMPSFFVSRSA